MYKKYVESKRKLKFKTNKQTNKKLVWKSCDCPRRNTFDSLHLI